MIATAICIATALVVIVAFFPGRINIDSLLIIEQARSGKLTDFHAPLLQWLWHLVYGLGAGSGAVLIVQVSVCVAGIDSILRLVLGRIGAAVGTAVVTLSPIVFGQLALVARDTWYLAGLLILLGATAHVLRTKRAYWPWVVIAVIGAWVALAARQNAAFAVVVGLWPLALLVLTRRQFPSRPVKPVAAAFAISLVALVGLLGAQRVHSSIVGVKKVQPDVPLYIYDLSAMSVRDHTDYFPASALTPAKARKLKQFFDPYEILHLSVVPGSPLENKIYNERYRQTRRHDLHQAWLTQIRHHPLSYLAARSRIFLRETSVTGRTVVVYYPVNYGSDYPTEFIRANDVSRDYMGLFHGRAETGGVVFTVWLYLLFALIVVPVLLIRRTFTAWCIAAPAGAALAHQIGIFIGLQGIAYRFEYPAVALIAVTATACIGVWLKHEVERRKFGPGFRAATTSS